MELACFPLRQGPAKIGTVGTTGGWSITSYFGPRIDPIRGGQGNHGGEDIAGFPQGEPYYAVASGIAYPMWDSGGGGNWTTLYFGGGRVGYGHQSRFLEGWQAGNAYTVTAGQVIGYAGTTGASTGTHLHFAYDSEDPDTSYNDPFDILNNAAAAGRFPGALSNPQPPTPPGGLSMSEYTEIMAGISRIEKALGTNLSIEGQWEQDTRAVVIEGTAKRVMAMLAGVDGDEARSAIATKAREEVNGWRDAQRKQAGEELGHGLTLEDCKR